MCHCGRWSPKESASNRLLMLHLHCLCNLLFLINRLQQNRRSITLESGHKKPLNFHLFHGIFHLKIFLLGSQPPGKECDYLDHSAIRSPCHRKMPCISALVKTLVELSVKASITARPDRWVNKPSWEAQ